jgi:hypothetical protein
MAKRREWLKQNLPAFLREYARTSRRPGADPNDRHYSREIEREVKRMDLRELDELLHDEDEGAQLTPSSGRWSYPSWHHP